MNIEDLLKRKILISPVSRKPLEMSSNGSSLITEDGTEAFPLYRGKVPILLENPEGALTLQASSPNIEKEYTESYLKRKQGLRGSLRAMLLRAYPSHKSEDAFFSLFNRMNSGSVCVGIGGGPTREHEVLINVNLAPYPNVDIAGDACKLPFAGESVDAVHCNAVLEHLENPRLAASEMFRVMKSGAKGYICTPFLQGFHGYPSHFQNFTVIGQEKLFQSGGFVVEESGVCIGPAAMITGLCCQMIRDFFPKPLSKPLVALWEVFSAFVRPLDIILNRSPKAVYLASTTYLVIRKP